MGGSEGVGVTERGAARESEGCGVEHGVLVGVGVDGLGVPDPVKTEQFIFMTVTSQATRKLIFLIKS